MNKFVHPSAGFNNPCAVTEHSGQVIKSYSVVMAAARQMLSILLPSSAAVFIPIGIRFRLRRCMSIVPTSQPLLMITATM